MQKRVRCVVERWMGGGGGATLLVTQMTCGSIGAQRGAHANPFRALSVRIQPSRLQIMT